MCGYEIQWRLCSLDLVLLEAERRFDLLAWRPMRSWRMPLAVRGSMGAILEADTEGGWNIGRGRMNGDVLARELIFAIASQKLPFAPLAHRHVFNH